MDTINRDTMVNGIVNLACQHKLTLYDVTHQLLRKIMYMQEDENRLDFHVPLHDLFDEMEPLNFNDTVPVLWLTYDIIEGLTNDEYVSSDQLRLVSSSEILNRSKIEQSDAMLDRQEIVNRIADLATLDKRMQYDVIRFLLRMVSYDQLFEDLDDFDIPLSEAFGDTTRSFNGNETIGVLSLVIDVFDKLTEKEFGKEYYAEESDHD